MLLESVKYAATIHLTFQTSITSEAHVFRVGKEKQQTLERNQKKYPLVLKKEIQVYTE